MELIEACRKCKYSLHRFCLHKSCKDCEMRDKERDVCKCATVVATIAPHEDCPYYEPAEEVNE